MRAHFIPISTRPRFHLYINLLCVPAICTELVILAWPGNSMPTVVCVSLGWTAGFITMNRYTGGLPIAICRLEEMKHIFGTPITFISFFSRLYYLFQGPKTISLIEEEDLLHFLGYCSPILSAMLITLHMAENFIFYADHPFLFHYR